MSAIPSIRFYDQFGEPIKIQDMFGGAGPGDKRWRERKQSRKPFVKGSERTPKSFRTIESERALSFLLIDVCSGHFQVAAKGSP